MLKEYLEKIGFIKKRNENIKPIYYFKCERGALNTLQRYWARLQWKIISAELSFSFTRTNTNNDGKWLYIPYIADEDSSLIQ